MKTKLLLSLALILTSMNVLSQGEYEKEINLIENKTEETIVYDKSTNEPFRKMVCHFNLNNKPSEKIIYKIDDCKKWVPSYKLYMTYKTKESTKPCSVTYTQWNKTTNRWNISSKTMNCIE